MVGCKAPSSALKYTHTCTCPTLISIVSAVDPVTKQRPICIGGSARRDVRRRRPLALEPTFWSSGVGESGSGSEPSAAEPSSARSIYPSINPTELAALSLYYHHHLPPCHNVEASFMRTNRSFVHRQPRSKAMHHQLHHPSAPTSPRRRRCYREPPRRPVILRLCQ